MGEARRNKKDRGQNDAIVEGGLASQLGILIPSSTDSTPESIMDEKKESGSKSSTNGTQEKDMVTKIIKENQNLETENDDGSKKELNNEKSSINLEVKTKGIISDDAQVPEGINSDSFRQQNGDPDRQGLQILNNIEKQIEKENNDLTIANDIKTPNNKMAHQKLKHNDNYYFGNHIRFYKNGKDLGVAFCHLPPGYYTPAISIYGGGGGLRANFGPKWIAVPEHLNIVKESKLLWLILVLMLPMMEDYHNQYPQKWAAKVIIAMEIQNQISILEEERRQVSWERKKREVF